MDDALRRLLEREAMADRRNAEPCFVLADLYEELGDREKATAWRFMGLRLARPAIRTDRRVKKPFAWYVNRALGLHRISRKEQQYYDANPGARLPRVLTYAMGPSYSPCSLHKSLDLAILSLGHGLCVLSDVSNGEKPLVPLDASEASLLHSR